MKHAQQDSCLMRTTLHQCIIGCTLSLLLAACGDVGSGVANPPTADPTKLAAAAVGSLFNQEGETNIAVVGKSDSLAAFCPNDPGCTCTGIQTGQAEPNDVSVAAFNDPGTYGADNAGITVLTDHFCTQPDGTANSGLGPDGLGRLAGFVLTGDVNTSCALGSTSTPVVMKTGSHGIWRNTDTNAEGVAYQPQIFGTFTFSVNGTEVIYDCTIYLGNDERIVFASCSDESGSAVSLESDASCQVLGGE
ncbi:MAG: hypothetical protein HY696_06390 [Deltaproteobacteria bacterium]|nr:hypothetical protein [Deltaproteobacteria bacterium]